MPESNPVPPVSGFKAKVAPELAEYVLPVTAATPHPDNARKHDLPAIARSLNKHGQRSVIVVQASTDFIVKGNGTWLAAAQILGWDSIAMIKQAMDDEQALAYLLADNKASDGSGYDNKALTKALTKLSDGPGLLDSLWTNEELEDLVEADAGSTIQDPRQTGAAFADAAYTDDRLAKAEAPSPRGKMKEVPVVLTMADHAAFVVRIDSLKKRFGTTGTVATIVEAIKRQAEAEDAAVEVGRDLAAERADRIKLEFVRGLAAAIRAMPEDRFSRDWLLTTLSETEADIAAALPVKPQLPGQLGAFELDPPAPDEVEPPDAAPVEAVDPEAALAAFRSAPEFVSPLRQPKAE